MYTFSYFTEMRLIDQVRITIATCGCTAEISSIPERFKDFWNEEFVMPPHYNNMIDFLRSDPERVIVDPEGKKVTVTSDTLSTIRILAQQIKL